MKLLNFSIGRVQTVMIGGETVRTAHVKAPVPEPWVVTDGGAEGDERAVHPDKLYAYPRSGYAYWRAQLGIGDPDWPDGYFGENLTLDALDETDVRIGDVFAIGEDVRLIVSGSRTPCIKLAWRLNQPRSFQETFARSRHTGVYLGVLAAGRVRPGDELRRIQHDPTMPSIADLCAFIANRKPPPVEPMRRLLAFDRLSATARLLLSAKMEAAESARCGSGALWSGWRSFTIDRAVDESRAVRSLYLRPSDGSPLQTPRPGQFVMARVPSDEKAVTRCWSISNFDRDMRHYRISVRRQQGPGSRWAHNAEPGASVGLRAPAGRFVLDLGSARPVALVGAGIGITPLLAMLHAHVARRAPPPIYVLHGGTDPADMPFRDELEAIANRHSGVYLHYLYSRASVGSRPAARMTAQDVIDALQDLHLELGGRRIALPWYEADLYVCGPGDFNERLVTDLVTRGAQPSHVLTERFVAAASVESSLATAEVRFARSGVTASWGADEDVTLLELAERSGISVANDCRAGACLSCRTRVLEGQATSMLDEGSALLCIGRPRSGVLVLDC